MIGYSGFTAGAHIDTVFQVCHENLDVDFTTVGCLSYQMQSAESPLLALQFV